MLKPSLQRLPKTRHPLQKYLDQIAHQMGQKMDLDWKPEAKEIMARLMEAGLLRSPLPMKDKEQFLADAVADNVDLWENSRAQDLMMQGLKPEQVQSATELAALLIPSPGTE